MSARRDERLVGVWIVATTLGAIGSRNVCIVVSIVKLSPCADDGCETERRWRRRSVLWHTAAQQTLDASVGVARIQLSNTQHHVKLETHCSNRLKIIVGLDQRRFRLWRRRWRRLASTSRRRHRRRRTSGFRHSGSNGNGSGAAAADFVARIVGGRFEMRRRNGVNGGTKLRSEIHAL
jgi:hypothetical protein